MVAKPSTPSTPTVRHILDNVLITLDKSEEPGLITLIRPDFSTRVQCQGITPNGAPARVELDLVNAELRVWANDMGGSARPDRKVKNAFRADAELMKVRCVKCGAMDVESFIGHTGENGWALSGGKATCPECCEVAP